MAELSQEDRDIIERYPLNDSLDRLHGLLQQAERGDESRSLSYDGAADDDPDQIHQMAISKLLSALMGERSAYNLRSPISSDNLASDLAKLFTRLQKGDFAYEHYRPLILCILQKATDSDIWKAAFDLITAYSRHTPLETVPTTADGTPWLSNSSSQRRDEQTREIVEARLFGEIKTCTYKNVEGFDAKYFRGNHWEERFTSIYERVLERGGGLTDFPDQQFERDVREWWFRFQSDFLAETRGFYYCTLSMNALRGSDAKRQLDLLMKARTNNNSDTKHHWKDVRVIGELKKSARDRKADLLQMQRYVREVFAAQPTRPFVHSFILCGTEMEMWVTDRSGPYSSGAFDIRNEPERFFRAIIGYTLMSDEELGLDTFAVLQDDGTRTIAIEDVHTREEKQLCLKPMPIFVQSAVVCRGTCCYLTENPDTPSSNDVVKFSWISANRRQPEVDLLRLAHERGVEGVAKAIGYRSITSVADLREGLNFKEPYQFRSGALSSESSLYKNSRLSRPPQPFSKFQGKGSSSGSSRKRKKSINPGDRPSKRSQSNSGRLERSTSEDSVSFSVESTQKPSLYATERKDTFENRIFRCLAISPAGRAIHRFNSPEELLRALRDAIKAHQSLYLKGNILHRDISENNIIITDPETANGHSGMLIDLDLAKELGSGHTGARHQTGTMEFMAIEVLLGIDHTYRHDLESFFYVLVWQCARNGWERYNRSKERPVESRLRKWYAGSYEDIADAKAGHMGAKRFENMLLEFPPELECVKPLCRQLRRILFPIFEGDIFTGTPVKPEKLYDPITQAFDKAIEDIENAEE